jgi:hypothetical protein
VPKKQATTTAAPQNLQSYITSHHNNNQLANFKINTSVNNIKNTPNNSSSVSNITTPRR